MFFDRKAISILTVTALLLSAAVAFARDPIAGENPAANAPIVATPQLEARVFAATDELRSRTLADYRKMLEVYYELKKKSMNPGVFQDPAYDPSRPGSRQPTTTSPHEFAFVHYEEFKEALDADSRLSGNVFVQKLKAYGGGNANDVFQRVGIDALESIIPQDSPLFRPLYRSVAYPVQGLTLAEALAVYHDTSAASGYPSNGRPSNAESLAEWQTEFDSKKKELQTELEKLGRKNRNRPLAVFRA